MLVLGLLIAAAVVFIIETIRTKSLLAAGLALVAIALAVAGGLTKK